VVNPEDGALWQRFRVCPFESLFVDETDKRLPATRAEQIVARIFPKNYRFIQEVIPKLKGPLCFYLLEHWRKTRGRDLDTPQCVIQASKRYRDSNNLIMIFITDKLTYSPNSAIKLDAFINSYYEWVHTYQKTNHRNLQRSVMIEEIRKCGVSVDETKGLMDYEFLE
jgi:phage/plasmid-associated DNA primase